MKQLLLFIYSTSIDIQNKAPQIELEQVSLFDLSTKKNLI